MLKKENQGSNIFEDLDNYERLVQERGGEEAKSYPPGQEVNVQRRRSSFPLPMTKGMKKSPPSYTISSSNHHHPRQHGLNEHERRPRRQRRHRHSFPLSNKVKKEFRSGVSLPKEIPPVPFPPVTTTTVTTTTLVGNPNHHHHHHPFHQGHYDAHQQQHQHRHPYRYTPSFDSIAAATGATSSSSVFLPSQFQQQQHQHQGSIFQDQTAAAVARREQTAGQHFAFSTVSDEDEIKKENATGSRDSSKGQDTRISANGDDGGEYLFKAEVQAIEALLSIRASE